MAARHSKDNVLLLHGSIKKSRMPPVHCYKSTMDTNYLGLDILNTFSIKRELNKNALRVGNGNYNSSVRVEYVPVTRRMFNV